MSASVDPPFKESTDSGLIGFGQISVIGYRLNLTDMPSLVASVHLLVFSLFLIDQNLDCMNERSIDQKSYPSNKLENVQDRKCTS